jgi:hypothetical protein
VGFLSIHFVRKGKYAHEIVFLPDVPGLCPDTILAVSFSFQEPTNELRIQNYSYGMLSLFH